MSSDAERGWFPDACNLTLALLTLLLGQVFDARNIVASVLVMVWATRLAGFLLFRVLKMGSDTRFDDIRAHFWKFAGFWVGTCRLCHAFAGVDMKVDCRPDSVGVDRVASCDDAPFSDGE